MVWLVLLTMGIALCLAMATILFMLIMKGSAVQDPETAIREETLLAEARIDYLTRRALQQMRDAARSSLRSREDRGA
jgi:hypothetical protein